MRHAAAKEEEKKKREVCRKKEKMPSLQFSAYVRTYKVYRFIVAARELAIAAGTYFLSCFLYISVSTFSLFPLQV